MIVFDFIFFSILQILSKAKIWKGDVACMIFTICTGLFLLGLFAVFAKKNMIEPNLIYVIVLFGGLFILSRKYFLKIDKYRGMNRRFRKISKLLLKTIGILYCLGCFVGFILLLVLTS